MKTKKVLQPIFILILLINTLSAQGTNSCNSDDHRAFDFWIGDWTVYNTNDQVIGTNKVVKMQNGCVLQENWEASNRTNTGTSYNFFDAKDNMWNQVWISNIGYVLRLRGNIDKNGAMVLKSKLKQGPKGRYYDQISWSKNEDGSVTQLWQIFNEQGKIIKTSFEGIYKKRL